LKNNPANLFFIGLMIGGAMMLFVVGFPFISRFFISKQTAVSIETSSNLPRLIALESTEFPRSPTQPLAPPTSTAKTNPASIGTIVSPRLYTIIAVT